MASVAEFRQGPAKMPNQIPHRKPLAKPSSGPPPTQRAPSANYIVPDHERYGDQPQPQAAPNAHARTRTSSSSVFPIQTPYPPVPQPQAPYQAPVNTYYPSDPRTLSLATTSTGMSSTVMAGPTSSSASSTLQRTVSARSGNSPLSYVALMRKQKATVWCERAQHEDPSLLRQQKIARERALREVASGNAARYSASGSSSLTGGVRSKIRHHAPKAQTYTPSTHPASGVPLRLSANEVDGDDSDEEYHATKSFTHNRTGSERSSLGSAGRMSSQYPGGRIVSGGTPPSGQIPSPGAQNPGSAYDEEETPIPDQYKRKDYFAQPGGQGVSAHSGSSSEGRENSFGGLGQIPQRRPQAEIDAAVKTEEELKRRGSVDDRTMTMSGMGKLFVANPDVD